MATQLKTATKKRPKRVAPKIEEPPVEANRYAHYSVDRLEDVVNGPHRWCVQAVKGVLIEEHASMYDDDLHYATFPIHRDLSTIGDLLRYGAPALVVRFREVDPLAWSTLIEVLVENGRSH